MGNLKWIVVALGILVALFLLVQARQSEYTTHSDGVFGVDHDAIGTIELWTKDDTLVINRSGDDWKLAEHDSLEMRPYRMDTFLDKVLGVKRETMVSKNPAKWATYSVDDSSGTHLKLLDASGKELVYAVFGRSTSDWSHNYVRTSGDDGVYLTDASVIHILYPRATYWGEKPVAGEEEADSSGALEDSTSIAGSGGEEGE